MELQITGIQYLAKILALRNQRFRQADQLRILYGSHAFNPV